MHKIKFNARSEYEYINNFKVLTGNMTIRFSNFLVGLTW